jgi:hypothetical protein
MTNSVGKHSMGTCIKRRTAYTAAHIRMYHHIVVHIHMAVKRCKIGQPTAFAWSSGKPSLTIVEAIFTDTAV